MSTIVVIAGTGARTAVGRGAWSTAAAVRAAISGFARHPFMADVEGRPVLVAHCPWLAPTGDPSLRISALLSETLSEALRPLDAWTSRAARSVALFVNLPLARPGLGEHVVDDVRGAVAANFRGVFSAIAAAQRGHAGALLALRSATMALEEGRYDACVVAGADSYLSFATLEWLEETNQLHGAGRRNNAWGFVPGEGAGALLLVRADDAVKAGLESLGRLLTTGIGQETSLIRSGSVCLGAGLTTAFKEVFSVFDGVVQVTDTYCDMNGEPYRADEYGFAVTRTREWFVAPNEFVAPADCWGDVGAASGVLGVTLATAAFRKGYANGNLALIWGSSDTGERGAALVARD